MGYENFLRFRRWGPSAVFSVVEALFFLGVASVAIRILPFRVVARLSARCGQSERPAGNADRAEAHACCWAVKEWAVRVPWKAVCFQRGVAVQLMLHRRGIRSVLHYGVAQIPDAGLKAHVWISVGGEVVLGGDTSEQFRCLATFPAHQSTA